MRKPFQILEEWRAAAAKLAAASDGAETAELEKQVDELRAEYLASFARELEGPPVSVPVTTSGAGGDEDVPTPVLEDNLVRTSDGFMTVARELMRVEQRKRTLDIGSDEFQVLARRVEALSRELLALSVQQRDTGEKLGPVAAPMTTVETLAGEMSA